MDQAAAELQIERDKIEDIKAERDTAQAELSKFQDFDIDKVQQELEQEKEEKERIAKDYNKYKRDVVLEKALQKSGAYNAKDLTGFIDYDALKFQEEENEIIIEGLEEQINGLRESKKYLFKTETENDSKFKSHTPPAGDPPREKEAESLTEALQEFYKKKE